MFPFHSASSNSWLRTLKLEMMRQFFYHCLDFNFVPYGSILSNFVQVLLRPVSQLLNGANPFITEERKIDLINIHSKNIIKQSRIWQLSGRALDYQSWYRGFKSCRCLEQGKMAEKEIGRRVHSNGSGTMVEHLPYHSIVIYSCKGTPQLALYLTIVIYTSISLPCLLINALFMTCLLYRPQFLWS